MSSLMWYICLGSISVIIAAFAVYKNRHLYKVSTQVVFYLFASCLTWIGEFTVLGIFNSYAYKPGMFINPWAENIVGHLILNCTMYPAAAVLMVVYSLRYVGISLIIAFFILAEYLFVKLGIYEQHWWRYYMSVIVIIVFLAISKKWFYKMTRIKDRLTRSIIFYFVAFIIIHLPAPLLLLAGKQQYSLGLIVNWVGDMYRASTILIFVYHLLESWMLVYFVCILDKWFWKLLPFAISITGQYVLAKTNILVFQDGWNLLYLNLVYVISLTVFILTEQNTLKSGVQ
ncbi:MAG: hypothetical protein N2645_22045 [Clostridia bacterium]|nr:hypothetical protein [Clostridia bacterium]